MIEKQPIRDNKGNIHLRKIGIVRNKNKETIWNESWANLTWQEKAEKMKLQRQVVSELVVDPELDGILDGIDSFSHLLVLYWAHQTPEDKRSLTRVHPMGRQDLPLTGIFATQSPVRPNPILATVVKLIKHKANILEVTGLDALDGSPVLDIKPYTGSLNVNEKFEVPDWIKRL